MDRGTVRLVAMREVWERLRSKAFLASTALSAVVVLGFAIIPALVADDGPTTYEVGVVGAPAADLAAAVDDVVAALPEDADVEVVVTAYGDEAAGRSALEDGDADAVVVDGTVLVEEELPDTLATILQLTQAADVPPPLDVQAIAPPDESADEREGLVFLGIVLLYGQLVGFGYWVATGIVEEKTSRVVEVLLAKAGPRDLVTGKILGIGALGFVQLVGFIALGLATAWAVGTIDLPPSTLRVAAEVLALVPSRLRLLQRRVRRGRCAGQPARGPAEHDRPGDDHDDRLVLRGDRRRRGPGRHPRSDHDLPPADGSARAAHPIRRG